jgi:hypothetical protein
MALPRGKAIVRIVPTWGEKSAMGGREAAGGVKPVRLVWKPVRPVWRQQGDKFGFHSHDESRFVAGGCGSGGWSGEFAGSQFAKCSHPYAKYGDGRSRSYEMERRNGPRSSVMILVLLQLERVGSLVVVTVVVFMEKALIGEILWSVLTPHWSRWLSTGYYSFGTNPSAESFVHSRARF